MTGWDGEESHMRGFSAAAQPQPVGYKVKHVLLRGSGLQWLGDKTMGGEVT